MLYAIAAVFLLLWFVGLVTSYSAGGFLHLLLIAAIIAVLASLMRSERRS